MYADDLALVADSPAELQHHVNLYREMELQPQHRKVVCDDLRRIPPLKNRSSWNWYLGNEEVEEADKVHHLGILRMVSLSTISRTTEWYTAGGSVFSALNSVGLRFGCLHPVMSRRLYSTLCLLIMLYGSELWISPSKFLKWELHTPNAKGITVTWKDLNDKLYLHSIHRVSAILPTPISPTWWGTLLLGFGTSFHLMPVAPGPTTTSRDGTTSWNESQGKLILMCSSLLRSSSKNSLTLRWALLSWIQGHSHLNEQRSQLTRTRKLENLKVDLARTRLL